MIISIVVAASQNDVIGRQKKLPWHLPADLKHFKRLTTGHHVIMGRNTYESIGRPLPNRVNIIVTRQRDYAAPGCRIAINLQEAFDMAKQAGETECFVIGGGDLIGQAIVWADRIYLTRIFHDFIGDTFLPQINPDDWKITKETHFPPDDKNPFPYAFIEYQITKSADPSELKTKH